MNNSLDTGAMHFAWLGCAATYRVSLLMGSCGYVLLLIMCVYAFAKTSVLLRELMLVFSCHNSSLRNVRVSRKLWAHLGLMTKILALECADMMHRSSGEYAVDKVGENTWTDSFSAVASGSPFSLLFTHFLLSSHSAKSFIGSFEFCVETNKNYRAHAVQLQGLDERTR